MTRSGLLALLALAGVALGLDLAAPPGEGRTAAFMVAGVRLYQASLAPLARRAGIVCRFEPTCSHYARAVLERYGAVGGTRRVAWRLMRCGPWTPAGTLEAP
ncbi:MAG: membrane protein insertion efficiency factor YidD [Thermoanaerobaculia bacterium]